MRHWLGLAIAVSFLAVGACGDDDDDGTTPDGGGGDGGGSAAPVITKVMWSTPSTCHSGMSSVYTINVTATDSDTATNKLTYSGMVTDCTGSITATTSTITCQNLA